MVLVPSVDAICVSGKTALRMEKFEEPNKPRARSTSEENVARLEATFEPHLRSGIVVGHTEGREIASTPAKFPETGAGGLDKTSSQNAPSQLEENVRKFGQLFSPDGHAGIVGHTGQLENRGGKVENQPARWKIDDNMSEAESENAPVKVDEKAGTGDDELGNAGQAEKSKPTEKPSGSTDSMSSGEVEQKKVEQRNTESCIKSGDEGSAHAQCVIQLASKGPAEAEYVENLKRDDGLQLPDAAVVTTAAEWARRGVREDFDVPAYLENLSTSQFGRLVLYSPLIPSTHTLLSQNYHSFPAGTVCVAGAQLQGKGRGGNVWQSPKGCLMFSFTTQMTNGRMVPFLQYVVSLAVVEAVEETCKAGGVQAPDVRIKWPNDLYVRGVKIGGVLCTSTYRAKTFNIVVGVGLNVGNREPTTCLDALIEELLHGVSAPTPVRQELLLAAIMAKFESLNSTFQDEGFLPLQEAYYRKWLHSGQSVVLEEREPGSSTVSHVAVMIQGLTPAGYLLASDDVGEQYELHPDGNSFDFLRGLVRQKLAVE